MKATFQGYAPDRSVSVEPDNRGVRVTLVQGTVIAGLAIDPETAVAFAAALVQVARQVLR